MAAPLETLDPIVLACTLIFGWTLCRKEEEEEEENKNKKECQHLVGLPHQATSTLRSTFRWICNRLS